MAAGEKMMAFHAFFTISTQLYHNYEGSTQKKILGRTLLKICGPAVAASEKIGHP